MPNYECMDDKYINSSTLEDKSTPIYSKCRNNAGIDMDDTDTYENIYIDDLKDHLSHKSNYDKYYILKETTDSLENTEYKYKVKTDPDTAGDCNECIKFQKYLKCQIATCNQKEYTASSTALKYAGTLAIILFVFMIFYINKLSGPNISKNTKQNILKLGLGLFAAGIVVTLYCVPTMLEASGRSMSEKQANIYYGVLTAILVMGGISGASVSKKDILINNSPMIILSIVALFYGIMLPLINSKNKETPDFMNYQNKSEFSKIFNVFTYVVAFGIIGLSTYVQQLMLSNKTINQNEYSNSGTTISMMTGIIIIAGICIYAGIYAGTIKLAGLGDFNVRGFLTEIMVMVFNLIAIAGIYITQFINNKHNTTHIMLLVLIFINMILFPAIFKFMNVKSKNILEKDSFNEFGVSELKNTVLMILLPIFITMIMIILSVQSNFKDTKSKGIFMGMYSGIFVLFLSYIGWYTIPDIGKTSGNISKLFKFSNYEMSSKFSVGLISLIISIFLYDDKDAEKNTASIIIGMYAMLNIFNSGLIGAMNYPDQFSLFVIGQKFILDMLGSENNAPLAIPGMPLIMEMFKKHGLMEYSLAVREVNLALEL